MASRRERERERDRERKREREGERGREREGERGELKHSPLKVDERKYIDWILMKCQSFSLRFL